MAEASACGEDDLVVVVGLETAGPVGELAEIRLDLELVRQMASGA